MKTRTLVVSALIGVAAPFVMFAFLRLERAAEPPSDMAPATVAKPDYAVVRTFFATDRNLTGKTKPDEMFGVERSSLTYGACDLSIPRDHRMGNLESPSIWGLEFP